MSNMIKKTCKAAERNKIYVGWINFITFPAVFQSFDFTEQFFAD